MKKFVLLMMICLAVTAGAESISDGTAYDPGARRKNVPITHNGSLTGLNEGDYQHLTALELAELQGIDTNYVATSSLVTALLGYALLNGSSVVDFAADHLTAATASISTTLTIGDGSDISIIGDGAGNASINTGDLTVNADVNFTGTVTGIEPGIATHNNLLGLNSGDYQHLTAAELTELQGIDTNYVATSSLVTVLLGYAALNGNIAEDFAADHIDAVTASFSGDVDVAGDLTVGSAVDMTMIGDGAGNVTIDTVATLTFAGDTDFNGVVDLTDATVLGLPASVATHNDLTGLNEGDYQHLTAAELAELQALDTNYVATSTLATTLADYSTSAVIAANYVATSTYDADMGNIAAALAAILGE